MDTMNCAYCQKGKLVEAFGYFAVELKTSNVYIFKEQSHYGRLIVAHKKHVSELIELSDEERNDYFKDIALVAKAMHEAFHPNKINYGAYGDTGHHLHFHLVPKYVDEVEWGSTFAMNPHLKDVDEVYCKEVCEKFLNALEKIK